MKQPSERALAGATAVAAGVAAVVGSLLAVGVRPAFVASPVASFLVRVTPDAVVRFAITSVTRFGERFGVEHLGATANLLLAITLAVALLGAAALAGLVVGRRTDRPVAGVVVGSALVALVALVVTGDAASAAGAGAGAGAVLAVGTALSPSSATSPPTGSGRVSGGRRGALGALATAFAATVGGLAFLRGGETQSAATGTDRPLVDTEVTDRMLAEAEGLDLRIGGLEGLVSGDDFYTVDINNVDPDLNADDWSLSVTGAVANAFELSYDDLLAREVAHRFVTLRCVSDPINGRNMDTDLWSGVPIESLLSEAEPQGKYVVLRAADDYYEEFPLAAFEGGLLAFAKGGEALPRKHGYPLRALVLGHWGEVNVKWLTEIEIHEEPVTGFWEKKGWHGTGPVNTVAKLHTTVRDGGRITVAGHAYAGTRGVDRVEVSIDGGESWNEATLGERLPAGSDRPDADHAADAWRQWAYEYEWPGEEHEVVVRAVDGTGAVQPRGDGEAPDGDEKPFPSGAVGWVRKTIRS